MDSLCLECSLPRNYCQSCTIPLQQSEIFDMLQLRVKRKLDKEIILISSPTGKDHV